MLGMLHTTSANLLLFSSGLAPEKMRGAPKTVRVMKREPRGPHLSVAYLEEVANYHPEGKIADRSVHREDSSLSYHWTYEYGGDGCLSKVTTFDAAGKTLTTRLVRKTENSGELEILLDPGGIELERTIVRRDETARLVECTIVDPFGTALLHMIVHNDGEGRPSNGQVISRADAEFAVSFEVRYEADHCVVVTYYEEDGTVLMQSKLIETDLDGKLSPILFTENGAGQRLTTERVNARDQSGNWIQKIIDSAPSVKGDETLAVIDRTITYY